MKQYILWFGRAVLLSLCAAVSVFLILSSYEITTMTSLPLVHSIDPVSLDAIAQSYDFEAAQAAVTTQLGSYGKPSTIKLPGRSSRLPIVAPIYGGGEWLARTNTFHMLITSPPRSSNIGVLLLYCRSSFRTIDASNMPETGNNIFIDTDTQWRYVYRVTSAKSLPISTQYVASDSGTRGQLLILCGDEVAGANRIIEATLLSVQGIE